MRIAMVAGLLAFFPSVSVADAWPTWRGPGGNAVAPTGEYPRELSEQTKVWEAPLPGEGSSTPVVWGDDIFLTATEDGHDLVCCYTSAGDLRWRASLSGASAAKHKLATGSNPSAVCNDDYVVAYFKSGNLVCLTHEGKEVWRRNIQELYGESDLWWDLGSSPVLSSSGVVIAVIQENDPCLVTLDLKTGQQVWKVARKYERPVESDQAYTTPAVIQDGGREVIVTWGADHLTGHDAGSGELLWECGGFNPRDQRAWRVIASATISDGVAYVPYGRGGYVGAVRVTGPSDATDEQRWLWNAKEVGADVPSAVVAGEDVFVLGDDGQISCLDAESGDTKWNERLPRSRNKYFSSPLLAGTLLYCVRQDGAVFVVDVDGGYRLVSEGRLDDEAVATPVPMDGQVLFRTRTKLVKFGRQAG